MNIYSGVPFTIGLFLLLISTALVITGWDQKVTDRVYKVSLGFLVLAAAASPVGWFFAVTMYQGFLAIGLVSVLVLALLMTVDYRQRKGLQ